MDSSRAQSGSGKARAPVSPGLRESGTFSFVAAVAYVIVEYMRFQERYDFLSGIPFGQIVGVLLIVACIAEQRRFPVSTGTFKWIIVFLVWLLLVSFLGPYASTSLEKWVDVVKMAVLAIFTAAALDTRSRVYKYVVVVLLVYFLHTNFSFRGWVASGFSIGFRGFWVGSGFLRNPNDFGAALAAFWGVSLAMIWADRGKRTWKIPRPWLHIVNTMLFVLATITSSSRGAAAAVVVGALYAAGRLRMLIRGLAMLALLGLIYIVTASPEQMDRLRNIGGEADPTSMDRIETWKIALEVFKDNPLTGIGVGVFGQVANWYTSAEYVFVQHNIYLQALTEAGIPGLLLLAGLLASFFRNQRYLRETLDRKAEEPEFLPWLAFGLNISMISFMVAGFFITVLFYPFMWVLLGLSMAARQIAESEREQGLHPLNVPNTHG